MMNDSCMLGSSEIMTKADENKARLNKNTTMNWNQSGLSNFKSMMKVL